MPVAVKIVAAPNGMIAMVVIAVSSLIFMLRERGWEMRVRSD